MIDIGTDIAITTSFSIHEINCLPANLQEVRCHVVRGPIERATWHGSAGRLSQQGNELSQELSLEADSSPIEHPE